MTDDNVTKLHNSEGGVVDFGVQIIGYTAVVDGREIPGLMVSESGHDSITITLDRRWQIEVPKHMSKGICRMIANALAIGAGYSHLGADSKDIPFAPYFIAFEFPEANDD